MKIYNYKILETLNILKFFEDKKLPQRISFAIAKNNNIYKAEYILYEEELKKIFNTYSDYFIKDEKTGEILYNSNGIPQIDKEHQKEMEKDIEELLNIETEINPYYISEEVFNYDAGSRYDILSPREVSMLYEILCK